MAKTPSFAGFWIRFLAYLIDSILINIVAGLAGIDLQGVGMILLSAIYFCAFWMWKAATPGGMILGLKVVSVDGKALNPLQVLLRYVGLGLSAIPLCIGLIWIAFDAQKQSWGDKIAKTFVVKNS